MMGQKFIEDRVCRMATRFVNESHSPGFSLMSMVGVIVAFTSGEDESLADELSVRFSFSFRGTSRTASKATGG